MRHHKESSQCYQIGVVEESAEKIINMKRLFLMIHRIILNSVEHVEDEYEIDMAKAYFNFKQHKMRTPRKN